MFIRIHVYMFKLLVCLLLSTDVLVQLIYIISIIHNFMFCICKPFQLVILILFGTNATLRLSSYMIGAVRWRARRYNLSPYTGWWWWFWGLIGWLVAGCERHSIWHRGHILLHSYHLHCDSSSAVGRPAGRCSLRQHISQN